MSSEIENHHTVQCRAQILGWNGNSLRILGPGFNMFLLFKVGFPVLLEIGILHLGYKGSEKTEFTHIHTAVSSSLCVICRGQGNRNNSKKMQLVSCFLRWPNSKVKETRHRQEWQEPWYYHFANPTLSLESQVIVIKPSRTCCYPLSHHLGSVSLMGYLLASPQTNNRIAMFLEQPVRVLSSISLLLYSSSVFTSAARLEHQLNT